MLPGNGNHGDGAGEWRRILQDAATGKRNTPGADNNDVTWYQQHLADGYVEGYSWGDWGTKKQAIKRAQDKSLKFNKGEISEVKVATFDPNVAIAHYKFTYDGTIDGITRISGETDFPCITDGRVGQGRVYAKADGPLSYAAWLIALHAGRSYVSDGRSHLIDFSVNGVELGTHASEV